MTHDKFDDGPQGRRYLTTLDNRVTRRGSFPDTDGGSDRRLYPGSGFALALMGGALSLLLATAAFLAGLGLLSAVALYLVGAPVLVLGLAWQMLRTVPHGAEGASVAGSRKPRFTVF